VAQFWAEDSSQRLGGDGLELFKLDPHACPIAAEQAFSHGPSFGTRSPPLTNNIQVFSKQSPLSNHSQEITYLHFLFTSDVKWGCTVMIFHTSIPRQKKKNAAAPFAPSVPDPSKPVADHPVITYGFRTNTIHPPRNHKPDPLPCVPRKLRRQ
jgi:hypothetical protein